MLLTLLSVTATIIDKATVDAELTCSAVGRETCHCMMQLRDTCCSENNCSHSQ